MKGQKTNATSNVKRIRPAMSPEARENQLVSLAVDLAEKQLLEGTASSQVITHYLKIGSIKEKKELELLEEQKKLMEAKTKAIASAQKVEELYANALDAFRSYKGQDSDETE